VKVIKFVIFFIIGFIVFLKIVVLS